MNARAEAKAADELPGQRVVDPLNDVGHTGDGDLRPEGREDGRCLVLERPSERRRGIAAFVVDAQHDAGATAVFNHDVRDGVFAAHAQRKRDCAAASLLGGSSDEDPESVLQLS